MDIAIRSRDGSVRELGESDRFVELRTSGGELSALFYMDALGRLHACTDPDSAKAREYSRLYGVPFARDVERLENR